MLLTLLPFFGSGFVPTESMPAGLRTFAEHQPFTPVMDTVRGLLLGAPIGNSGLLAVAWCAAITAFGYVWARRTYERRPARQALTHGGPRPSRGTGAAAPGQRLSAYVLSRPRLMIVFWISLVPSPMSRNGASRMSRSISYSLE